MFYENMVLYNCKQIYFDYLPKAEFKNISLEILSGQNNFEQQIYDSEQTLQIHKILHKLEEFYQEIFMLRVFAEYADIGAIFNKTENWAGVIFYRAKKIN